jgi:hypothetical protein
LCARCSAVDRDGRRLERLGGLACREPQHVAQDQDSPLSCRQVLQRRREGKLDPLSLLVAGVRAERAAVEGEPLVRVGLEPDRLEHRLRRAVVRVGRRRVVDRQHAFRAAFDCLQARVGGDLVQPGAKRASPLEPRQPPPGAEQRLLQRVLGVRHRAEHAVAVGLEREAIRLDELAECLLVAPTGGFEQPVLVRYPGIGRHRFGSQRAISPPTGVETTLRHPAGPSRGSSKTAAPSHRARSVTSCTSSTSTYGSHSGL